MGCAPSVTIRHQPVELPDRTQCRLSSLSTYSGFNDIPALKDISPDSRTFHGIRDRSFNHPGQR